MEDEAAVDGEFLDALARLPSDHSTGWFEGRHWGVTLNRSAGGQRQWLWGEELGGTDRVSFNLYLIGGRPALRPCEMPAGKVVAFVLGYRPEGRR